MRFLVALLAALCIAQAQSNPFDTPQGVEQGAALFQTHCSYCHGARGQGSRGSDLTTGQYRHGGSDASLFKNVRNGIPGTEMPVVRATDDEVWKMVAFVKKLGTAAPVEKAAGDPAAGKLIYQGKGRCASCHSIGREGGILGPALTDVGRRRDLKYLEESLVNPGADVANSYRAVRIVSKSGEAIAGIRLNEDDLSIQLRDEKQDLRSFVKADLREIRHDKPSLMPSYGEVLSRKEIADVVAYLAGLRGVQ